MTLEVSQEAREVTQADRITACQIAEAMHDRNFTRAHELAARHRQQAERDVIARMGREEVVVDSGFSAENISAAQWLWTNLPTGNRKWHSLPTHEKALVCHMVERLRERLYALPTPPAGEA